jgi:cytochrome b6-f complex iron-sulfur subunit
MEALVKIIADYAIAEKTTINAKQSRVKTRRFSRRSFLSWVGVAWAAFTAATATISVATARYMYPNVLFEPNQTFEAGFPNQLRPGEVDERFKQSERVWLVRDTTEVYALLAICTHLGCTPNWFPNEQTFKCPCHGSGYYKSGINFEGPTPRPLERVSIALADDGQIKVDKSKTYRYELGQWSQPGAFLKV